MERPILNLGHTVWWQPTEKDIEEKEAFAFCLLVLTLMGKLIHPSAEAFLVLEPSFSVFQHRLKASSSLGILGDIWSHRLNDY